MKKFLSVLFVCVLMFSACSCGSASAAPVAEPVIETAVPSQTPEVTRDVTVVATSVPATSEPVEEESGPVCTIEGGGYVVDVLGAEVTKDGCGNDCIAIRFNFTNNNSQATSFMWIAQDLVYQDGSLLTMDGMFPNGSDPTQTSWVNQISNGQTIGVTYIYPYKSDSPINLTLNILRDFNSMAQLGSGSCTLELA